MDEDSATASGRGEGSRADAPVSHSEQGTAKSEVCLLHQAVTAHGRFYCTWKCNTCLSIAST